MLSQNPSEIDPQNGESYCIPIINDGINYNISFLNNEISIFSRCELGEKFVDANVPAYISFKSNVLYPITEISGDAFVDSNYTSITLPETLYKLSAKCFYKSKIKLINLKNTKIQNITDSSMSECHNLTTVMLSDTTERIEDYSFYYSELLENVNIPISINFLGIGAFAVTSLTKIDLSQISIEFISSYLFYNSYYLASIVLPNNIQYIGKFSFYNTSLSQINWPQQLQIIEDFAFAYTSLVSIDFQNTNLSVIKNCAYQYCFELEEITFSLMIWMLGNYAYKDCISLQKVIISGDTKNNLTVIGSGVFSNTSFTKFDIGILNVDNVPTSIFMNSGKLSSVLIPSSVVSFGESCFDGTQLTKIELPTSFTSFGKYCMRGTSIASLNLDLPQLTLIAAYSFAGMSKLKEITFGDQISHIEANAFSGTSLPVFRFPPKIQSVGGSVLFKLISLRTCILHPAITSVDGNAFNGCSNLRSIVVEEASVRSSLAAIEYESVYDLTKIKSFGLNSFQGCGAVHVIFGPELQYLEYDLFLSCPSLQTVDMSLTQVTRIPQRCFGGCTSLRVANLPRNLTIINSNGIEGASGMYLIYCGNNNISLSSSSVPWDTVLFTTNESVAVGNLEPFHLAECPEDVRDFRPPWETPSPPPEEETRPDETGASSSSSSSNGGGGGQSVQGGLTAGQKAAIGVSVALVVVAAAAAVAVLLLERRRRAPMLAAEVEEASIGDEEEEFFLY